MKSSDKLLIGIILSITFLITVLSFQPTEPRQANVIINGDVIDKIILDEIPDGDVIKREYKGVLGTINAEFTNEGARIVNETSRYNYCSLQGWAKQGEPIVCLPNGFAIEFSEQASNSNGADGVVR